MKVQLSQIEDFESTPSRSKIQWKERKNGRRQELVNDKEWYHCSDFYNECRRFIRANVGHNFDKVFSEFCKKYPKFVNDINTRTYFMEQFCNEVHKAGLFSEFEIDDYSQEYFTDLYKNTHNYKGSAGKDTRFTFTECYVNPKPYNVNGRFMRDMAGEIFLGK